MTRRKEIIARMGDVEREYHAAVIGVARLAEAVGADPGVLNTAAVVPADVRRCLQNLEATYLVRLFAVFEEALRDVWATAFQKRTYPKAVDLLNGCAARQHVKDDDRIAAQAVRDYRNYLVHGTPAPSVALPTARARLCTFFGWMPPQWG